MPAQRIGGILALKVDGTQYLVKGNWTWNPGVDKKEMVVGSDSVHGYKQMPQVPFIEGVITHLAEISVKTLQSIVNATATLQLANGVTVSIENAVFAGDGNVTTEEGEIAVRFEGTKCTELQP